MIKIGSAPVGDAYILKAGTSSDSGPGFIRIIQQINSTNLDVGVYLTNWSSEQIGCFIYCNINDLVQIKIKYDSGTYSILYKVNNGEWTIGATETSKTNISYNGVVNIGSETSFAGSIDLKHFSITVDGKEVFNGLMSSTKPIYDKITTTNTTLSTFQTDTTNNFSAVNSALNEKANLSDLANYVPLATYNQLSDVAVKSSTVRNIVQISQTDYDALTTKDSNTLYIIV